MQHPRAAAGFTLIELMVVIGIIALLSVALLPRVIESQETAYKASDEAHMRWHYENFLGYKNKYKRSPRGGGSQFVLDPWVRDVCEHTEANFEKYWTPGLEDPNKFTLKEDIGIANIWKSLDDITSADTNYAGRAKAYLVGKIWSGTEPFMANDNEYGPAFNDQTINVLWGNGHVTQLLYDRDLQPLGYEGDGKENPPFEVGPDSPHEALAKLER